MPSGDESGELAVTLQRWWDMVRLPPAAMEARGWLMLDGILQYSMFESIQLVPRSLQTAAQTREASPANR